MSTNDPSLSNWGRWGSDDQRGTFNLMSPEIVQAAARLVKTGTVYSLSVPLEHDGPLWPPREKPWRVTLHRDDPRSSGGAGDAIMMHSHSGTHIDALCHYWYDGQMYNGYDAGEHVSSLGVERNAIDNLPYLVGRGVLLDMAAYKGVEHLALGEAISADDLHACAAAQQVEVRSGDIILLRTGWMRVFSQDRALFDSGEPGIDLSVLPWLKQHDIAAIGADNHGVEVMRSIPPDDLPIHRIAIRDLGLYLFENLDLEQMAADKAYESLVVVAPLRLTGGAGSPVNPIAIS